MFNLQETNPSLYRALNNMMPQQSNQRSSADNVKIWQDVIKNLPPEAIPYKRGGTPKVMIQGVEQDASKVGFE